MAAPALTKPVSKKRKTGAWLFALAGLFALSFSAHRGWQRYRAENPTPLTNVIAPIPPEKVDAVQTGLKIAGKTILRLSAEQQAQVDEIWKNPPRSLEEAIDYLRRTDSVMTPAQRALFHPMRKTFQDRVIDEMLAPAGKRMPPEDFQKMTEEVKKRVDQRIDGNR